MKFQLAHARESRGPENATIKPVTAETPTKGKNRVEWVDYGKGLLIVLVVYGHVLRGLKNAGLPLDSTFFQYTDSLIYSFHMPAFFFLSGLFIGDFRQLTVGQFLQKRWMTILYPYILWSVIQGSLSVFMGSYTNGSREWSDLLSIPVEPIDQFWFLHCLFIIHIMFFMFHRLPTRWLMGLAMVFWYVSMHFEVPVINMALRYFFFAALGHAVTRHNIGAWVERQSIWMKAALLGSGLLIPLSVWLRLEWDVSIPLVSALAGTAMLVVIAQALPRMKATGWIRTIGTASMSIYLLHTLSSSGARIILTKIADVDDVVVHQFVGVLMGVVLPLLVLYLARKLKLNTFAALR